jgi:hypothetical protein
VSPLNLEVRSCCISIVCAHVQGSSTASSCIGVNVSMADNTAAAGENDAYLADSPAVSSLRDDSGTQPLYLRQGNCTRRDLNTTTSTSTTGPPCALQLWSPAGGTLLPYVNNGSGLPTINATVVDCWCTTVRQVPCEYGTRDAWGWITAGSSPSHSEFVSSVHHFAQCCSHTSWHRPNGWVESATE